MAIGVNWGEVWAPVWKAVWTQSPPVPPTPDPTPTVTPAGSSRKRRYVVAIDGQDFIVSSQAEAISLLQRARAIAEQQAEKLADTAVRKLKRKRKVPKVALPAPAVTVPAEFRADLAPLIADIERLYRQAAVAAEIRLRLAQLQNEEDDDEESILLAI